MFPRRLLLTAAPAPETGPPPAPTPTPPAPAPEAEKINYKDLMARHNNDAHAAMMELWPRIVATTQTLADLRAEVATLKARVPAEGAVLIPHDKATLWAAVKDVTGDPKEIAAAIKDFPVVSKELADIKARDRLAKLAAAARVEGRKVDPEVFGRFFGNLDFVTKEHKDKDSDEVTQVLHVKHKDGDKEVETEFGEYVKAREPKLIPSLRLRRAAAAAVDDEIEDEEEEVEAEARPSRLPVYHADDEGERVPVRGGQRTVQQLIEKSGGRYGY